MDKPAFDPNQPFQAIDKPAFDPNQPFQAADQPTEPQHGYAADTALSVASKLGQQSMDVLGMGGTIRHGLSAATDYLAPKLGLDPQQIKQNATNAFGPLSNIYDPQQVRDFMDKYGHYVGGSGDSSLLDYQSQHLPGKVAGTLASYSLGMAAPETLLSPASAARTFLTNVAAPAAVSEAAGKTAEALAPDHPGWATAARIGGAFAGGAGASKTLDAISAANAAKQFKSAMGDADSLVQKGSNQFDEARNMGVKVTPQWTKDTTSAMRKSVEDYDPETIKPVLNAINRADSFAAGAAQKLNPNATSSLTKTVPAKEVDMNNLELVRKQLSNLRKSPDATIRSAAKEAQLALTDRQGALTNADTVSGNGEAYSQKINEAVKNYGAGKRGQVVEGKLDLAEQNANTAGKTPDEAQKIRQSIKQLTRPINNTNVPTGRKLGFNGPELAQADNVTRGGLVGNTARYISQFAPTGIVSTAGGLGMGEMIGHALGADTLGAAIGTGLGAAGTIAKKIGDLSTKRAASALESLVLTRSPHAVEVAKQLPDVASRLSPQAQQALAAQGYTPRLYVAPNSSSNAAAFRAGTKGTGGERRNQRMLQATVPAALAGASAEDERRKRAKNQ